MDQRGKLSDDDWRKSRPNRQLFDVAGAQPVIAFTVAFPSRLRNGSDRCLAMAARELKMTVLADNRDAKTAALPIPGDPSNRAMPW